MKWMVFKATAKLYNTGPGRGEGTGANEMNVGVKHAPGAGGMSVATYRTDPPAARCTRTHSRSSSASH